jgi:flagellar hook-length control protein FliK
LNSQLAKNVGSPSVAKSEAGDVKPLGGSDTLLKTEHTEFKITLNPEHLGKVTVRLATDGVKLSVLIVTATNEARDLLMARAHSVRVMVELSGVQVERYEVVSNSAQQSQVHEAQSGRDVLDDKNGNNQQQSKDEKEHGDDSDDTNAESVGFAEFLQTLYN